MEMVANNSKAVLPTISIKGKQEGPQRLPHYRVLSTNKLEKGGLEEVFFPLSLDMIWYHQ